MNITASVKQSLLDNCPKGWRLPLTYHYWKFLGKLEPEIFLLKDLVGEGKTALDIGANHGLYSYALAHLCEQVEAFEPQPWCCEIISAYNQSTENKIKVHNVGIADLEGSLTLHIPLINDKPHTGLASFQEVGGAHKSITVPVRKIDDYNFENVSFVKIDVEGYESEVIEGARHTIAREKPILLIEIEQRHLMGKPIESVFAQIIELGYEGSFLYQGEQIVLSEFSSAKYQNQLLGKSLSPYCDEFSPDYVNNFIFKPV